MQTSVIVAIPRQDDYVWRISSEKIPHVTLCYLADLTTQRDIAAVTSYVEHVANFSMASFGLAVERRGLLGDQNADVLFFGNKHGTEKLKQYREYLLKDETINRAYLAAPQFPEFTPHLTLGYPDAPAHEDPRDYPGIQWINFDRIAFWTGNFEGPTFDLKENNVIMSDVDSVLAHFGVRGMKWGKRRLPVSQPSTDAANARSVETKMKTQGLHALSNKELQDLVTRMNLERQLKTLQPPSKTDKAVKFVSDILVGVGKQQIQSLASQAAAKQIAKMLVRA